MNLVPQTFAATDQNTLEGYLNAAEKIGHQLCRDALWDGDRCTWMGWAITAAEGRYQPAFRTATANVYDGTAGIALFLARLWELRPGPVLKRTLEGAVAQSLARLTDYDTPPLRGFYSGSLGLACILSDIADITGRDDWQKKALEIAERDSHHVFEATSLDVMAGCASAVPALIRLGIRHKKPALCQAAVRMADQILKAGVADTQGLSWPSVMPSQHNLLCYAHGVSGMVMALLEAAAISGRKDMLAAALEGLRYEQSWFSAEKNGWPDFRLEDPQQPRTEPNYNCSWCNGATGIGMARLRVLQLLPERAETRAETEAALQAATALLKMPVIPEHADFCLCHGLTGVADFVLAAGQILQRPDMYAGAEEVGQFCITNYQMSAQPWPCGVQQRGEAPGLMLGIAGIGYYFLRLCSRGNIPSVLQITLNCGENATAASPQMK